MDKLAAVNEILSRSGRMGCNALDPTGSSDASIAERILDEVILAETAEGWHFNTRECVEITATASGRFAVPEGAITIDTDGPSKHRNVTQKGGYLFDLDNNSEIFDEDTLTVTYTLWFDFDCLPYPIRKYVTLVAAAEFNTRYSETHTNSDLMNYNRRQRAIEIERDRRKGKARRYDAETKDVNIFDSIPGLAVRGGRVTAGVVSP